MSPDQRLATIRLRTTNLINELHQLNLLRNKFQRAKLSARRTRSVKERVMSRSRLQRAQHWRHHTDGAKGRCSPRDART